MCCIMIESKIIQIYLYDIYGNDWHKNPCFRYVTANNINIDRYCDVNCQKIFLLKKLKNM